MMASIQKDTNVDYVEPDVMMYPLAVPGDTRYAEQWQYFEATGGLNLPTAWDSVQGNGVVVAVIDTGYLPHADLVANILPGYDMISDAFVSQDGDGRDGDAYDNGDWTPANACYAGSPEQNSSWHGTHVAGTVGAEGNNGIGVTGVNWNAKIMGLKVGTAGGGIPDSAVIEALNYMVTMKTVYGPPPMSEVSLPIPTTASKNSAARAGS